MTNTDRTPLEQIIYARRLAELHAERDARLDEDQAAHRIRRGLLDKCASDRAALRDLANEMMNVICARQFENYQPSYDKTTIAFRKRLDKLT